MKKVKSVLYRIDSFTSFFLYQDNRNNKLRFLSLCFVLLFVSCKKQSVLIENVSFKESLVYFENEPLSGSVVQNYSNGSIYKSFNVEDGIILDQTHFSKQGDTLATMYYNEDGSYSNYIDKTLEDNNINFACKVISSDGSGTCLGSQNIPDASYRLARLYEFWIKSNNLTKDYGSASPPYPKGGAIIGRVRGESEINITGINVKDYFQLKLGNSSKLKGPFTAETIFVSVRYSTDGFNESNFNEEASLSWNNDEQDNDSEVFSPSNIIMSANYSPNNGSSSGATFRAFLDEGGESYVMNVSGSNNNFIYSAEMKFPSVEDFKKASEIFTGYNIINPPGYDFNQFELYWNGDVKQGSVLPIRRNYKGALKNQNQIDKVSNEESSNENDVSMTSKFISDENIGVLIENYYSDLNNERFDANNYYSQQIDQFITLKNITPSELNSALKYNNDYQNGTSTIEENSLAFDSTEEDLSFWTFWLTYNCYRPSKKKYQECKINVRIGVDDKFLIHSYKEMKVKDLKFY